MKKRVGMIGLLLGLCLSAVQAQIAENVPYDFEKIVKNPTVIGQISYESGEAAYKGRSMRLHPGSRAEFGVTLQPHSTYVMTVMLRTESGEDLVTVEVSGLGANNVTASSALADWTEIRRTVHVSGQPGRIALTFTSSSASGDTSAWVDEISFVRTGSFHEVPPRGIKPLPARKILTDRGITMQPDEKMTWMQDAKFGMFIHWGLYAGPGRGEWYMERSGMKPEEYRRFAYPDSGDSYFDAGSFDPSEWAALAVAAGMKYMNMTAQHHDGYALFESRHPNAFTSKQTHDRDFVREYVEACRAAGLRVGLYKTLINWRYPGYYDVSGTDCKPNRFGYVTDSAHKENARVMKEELYCQVKELMTRYGRIDQLFWDGGWLAQQGTDADAAGFWESGRWMDPENEWPVGSDYCDYDEESGRPLGLMGIVRKYQPDILVNPRCGWYGDYKCEEGGAPVTGPVRTESIYEKCMSVGPGWGYTKALEDPQRVLSAQRIKRMLSDCVVRNMNLLLNVGPDRFGNIPETVQRPLLETGKWLEEVGEAVYGTRGGPWDPVDGEYGYAYRGNVIYVYFLGGYDAVDFTLPPVNADQRLVRARRVGTDARIEAEQLPSGAIVLRGISPERDEITIVAVELSAPVMP